MLPQEFLNQKVQVSFKIPLVDHMGKLTGFQGLACTVKAIYESSILVQSGDRDLVLFRENIQDVSRRSDVVL